MRLETIKITLSLILLLFGLQRLNATDVEFPLIQSLSYFPYAQHRTLEKGERQLSMDIYYSNVYMYDFDRTTINDMDLLSNTLAFRYGLNRRFTVELYYRAALAYGGMTDKLIIDFHKFFGLSEGGRHDYPRNTVHYSYKDAFSHSGSPMAQFPLVLGLLGNFHRGKDLHVNGRLAVGIPLGSKKGFSSGNFFAAGGLILLYKPESKKFSASWATHYAMFGTPKWLAGEELKKGILHSELRVDFKPVFVGLLYRSTPFRVNDLANGAYQIYLGVKFLKYFEFSLIEELPPMDTTPDVTFNLKIKLLGR